jgi:hypothetical protein
MENIGFLINGKIIKYCSVPITFESIVKVTNFWTEVFRYYLFCWILKNQFYFNIPRYMYIFYKLMFGLVYREPKLKDIVYHISYLDIYCASDIL